MLHAVIKELEACYWFFASPSNLCCFWIALVHKSLNLFLINAPDEIVTRLNMGQQMYVSLFEPFCGFRKLQKNKFMVI